MVSFIKSHYEVGYKKINDDGEVIYTPIAITMTEDNAMLLVHSLQRLDEDEKITYIYRKIK